MVTGGKPRPSKIKTLQGKSTKLDQKKLRLIAVFGISTIYWDEIKTGVLLHQFPIAYLNLKSIGEVVVQLQHFM